MRLHRPTDSQPFDGFGQKFDTVYIPDDKTVYQFALLSGGLASTPLERNGNCFSLLRRLLRKDSTPLTNSPPIPN
ncbi:hypothetical protein AVEN_152604-1 [Araneus ventricosus]|uniref:Uncharacterized protein n=1 Tax=Araneus ventricosus TaxID=182803 RepID=A0A4Y2QRG2_ARAVE|nr:hypothetical protein AVEN_152604-1 [Araneus ventricosus]